MIVVSLVTSAAAALILLFAVPRLWRGQTPMPEPPITWLLGERLWRACARSLALAPFVFIDAGLLAAAPSLPMAVFTMSAFAIILGLIASIALFNRPRHLVLAVCRCESGLLADWRSRHSQ
jgi:hypothetical protein